jgi:hypothetical protein
MKENFGHIFDEPCSSKEYLFLEFSPNIVVPLNWHWRNNALSADFLANYLTIFFANDENKQKEIKCAISYVANELLENAVKFQERTSQYSIQIQLKLYADHLMFFVTNSISPQTVPLFQTNLQELLENEPQALWIQKLTNYEEGVQRNLELSLLSILLNYEAKFHWTFETLQTYPNEIIMTTQVELKI